MLDKIIVWFGMLGTFWIDFWARIDGNALVACLFAVVGIFLALRMLFRGA